MYADESCWMIRCKCVIHQATELRPWLLGLWGEIMQTIDWIIQSKRYNQRYGQSDIIKAMQLSIRQKWYNQSNTIKRYGQSNTISNKISNQSDMARDMIKINSGLVTLSVALTQRSETQTENLIVRRLILEDK